MNKLLLGSALLLTACAGHGIPMPSSPATSTATTAASSAPAPAARLRYPVARRDDVVDTLHGTVVADPYRWLENGKSPEVRSWVAAQIALSRGYLDALPGRAQLRSRLDELLHYDELHSPCANVS